MIAWYRRWTRVIESILMAGLTLGIAGATTHPVGSVLMAMLSGGFLTIAVLESIIATRSS